MNKLFYIPVFLIVVALAWKIIYKCIGKTEKFSEDVKKVYFIYADWCGHCTRFKPEWQKFETSCSNNNVEAYALNVDDQSNSKFIESNGVSSFPTVIVMKGNGEKTKYEGERTSEDLMNFVKEF